MILKIDSSSVKEFTEKLEKLHRSALPSAVRGALNKAVYDVKKHTMPRSARKEFMERQQNFFKANSRFENATGFNISAMKSTVGMISTSLKGDHNYSVKDLEQQEYGGRIKKKSFIPLNTARSGNSNSRNVRPNARLKSINRIVNTKNAKGKNEKERFIKSVIHAGVGGNVLSKKNGIEILWRVNSTKRTPDGRFKLTPLYSFDKGRSVNVGKTGFMRKASFETANNLDKFYIQEAERQILKFK